MASYFNERWTLRKLNLNTSPGWADRDTRPAYVGWEDTVGRKTSLATFISFPKHSAWQRHKHERMCMLEICLSDCANINLSWISWTRLWNIAIIHRVAATIAPWKELMKRTEEDRDKKKCFEGHQWDHYLLILQYFLFMLSQIYE